MALTLNKLFPRVAPSTSLKKVVQFKKQRREELFQFRKLIDDTQARLAKCNNTEEAKLVIVQFREQLELGLNTIHRLMKERGMRSIVGSLRTIFTAKAPAWLALLGSGAGKMTGDPTIAIIAGTAGYVAGGAIELANYYLDARAKDREIQTNPYSYLYYANNTGIT